jgi:hypothetical protein
VDSPAPEAESKDPLGDPVDADTAAAGPLEPDGTAVITERVDDSPAAEVVPVLAPVGAAGTGPAAGTDRFFDAEDAQSFQERWRDVQLRFVDSPKEAAADGANLVGEAVDKLIAGLQAQRDGLTGDTTETDDTEELRVRLRGYRDTLNRVLGL